MKTVWNKLNDLVGRWIWLLYLQVVLKMTERQYKGMSHCPFCGAVFDDRLTISIDNEGK